MLMYSPPQGLQWFSSGCAWWTHFQPCSLYFTLLKICNVYRAGQPHSFPCYFVNDSVESLSYSRRQYPIGPLSSACPPEGSQIWLLSMQGREEHSSQIFWFGSCECCGPWVLLYRDYPPGSGSHMKPSSCQGALTWPAGTFPLSCNISISVNIYWQLAAEQMLCDESLGNPNVTCLQKVGSLLEIQPAFVDEKPRRAKSPRAAITRLMSVLKV